jgi:ABC-type microcin C transport system permease subunit YejB
MSSNPEVAGRAQKILDHPNIQAQQEAIKHRDYPVLQGGILFIAFVVVLINLAVDIAYGFLDPRIRLSGR